MGIGFPELLTAVAGLNAVAPTPEPLPKLLGVEGTLVAGAPNPDVAPNPVEGVLGAVKLLLPGWAEQGKGGKPRSCLPQG